MGRAYQKLHVIRRDALDELALEETPAAGTQDLGCRFCARLAIKRIANEGKALRCLREVIGTDRSDVCLRETKLILEQTETFLVPLRILRSKLEHLAFQLQGPKARKGCTCPQ